jgi:hypothetical protein
MKNKFFLFFYVIGLYLNAQTVIGVDTLWKSGPINKRINLVIMGDGYINSEIPLFLSDATANYSYLLNLSPFNNYKNYFNVFAIKCVSPQSGVSHPGAATDVVEPVIPISSVANSFNTRFDNYGTHRLIYSMNSAAVYATLATYFPNYDQVIILGNSPEYGGAGGAYAVSSTHSNAKEIVAHEMGHSFAGLADEYWAGAGFATEKPNMTAETNTVNVKWAPWLGLNAIGLYPYGTVSPDNTWFRPHQNCKMRYLNQPFCSVCKEAIIEKIHELTNPIERYEPSSANAVYFTTATQWFKTKLIYPTPNTLKKIWTLNSVDLPETSDSLLLAGNLMPLGNNSLLFTTLDTTVLSKDISHPFLHSYSILWSINNYYAGIRDISAQMEYSIFPNPASDKINLKYNLLEESTINISILDLSGKKVITNKAKKQAIGEYENEIDLTGLTQGTYFLSIKINSQTINNKFLVIK